MRRLVLASLALILFACSSEVIIGQMYRNRLARTSLITSGDGHPSIALTSCPGGVVATSTSPYTIVGTAVDDVSISSVSCTNDKGGACTVSGTTSWSASVVLTADDTNTVTFTASDGTPPNATAVCAITYTTPDPTAPVVEITSPTSSPDFGSTTLSTLTMRGTCTDNVACSFVRCQVNGGPWATDNTVSAGWSVEVGLSVGANTVLCHAQDEQTNSHEDTMTATRTVDASRPVVNITHVNNDANTMVALPATVTRTTNNKLRLTVNVTDASGVQRLRYFPCSVGSYITYAQGGKRVEVPAATTDYTTTFLNAAYTLEAGEAEYCVRAWDENHGDTDYTEDRVTVTYTPPVSILTLGAPPARIGTSYSYDFEADGGTEVYTWDNASEGSNLDGTDADCGGLTITSVLVSGVYVGRISGTPSAGMDRTCTLTVRACDNAGTPSCATSNTRTIAVQAAALESPHFRFNTIAALPTLFPILECASTGGACTMRDGNNIVPQAQGGMGTDVVGNFWTSTADYAQSIMGGAVYSYGPEAQLTSTIEQNTGDFLISWEAFYGLGWRPHFCRAGAVLNYEAGYAHKEFRAFMGDEPSDSRYNYEFQWEFGSATSCDQIALASHRWYGSVPTGVQDSNVENTLCSPSALYYVKPLTWTGLYLRVELNKTEADFPDFAACPGGSTLAAGCYHRVTAWAWDEWSSSPVVMLNKVPDPCAYNATLTDTYLNNYKVIMNTSSHAGSLNDNPAVTRLRNWSILKNYVFSDSDQPWNDTTVSRQPRR